MPTTRQKLQITDDIDRIACDACGNEHIVNRYGSIVSLKPIMDNTHNIVVSSLGFKDELDIKQLKDEKDILKIDSLVQECAEAVITVVGDI